MFQWRVVFTSLLCWPLMFAALAEAQGPGGAGTFCYFSISDGVTCIQVDSNGTRTPAPRPAASGGSFSQQDSRTSYPRDFGACTPEHTKSFCKEQEKRCKEQTEPGKSRSFPSLFDRIYSDGGSLITLLSGPGRKFKALPTWAFSCKCLDADGEPPVATFEASCRVRVDFSY